MLRKTVKELGFHSLIYMVGGVASALASIILLPIYTRFLPKADYGILEIIDSMRTLLMNLLLAGFVPAMAKFYKEADSEEKQRIVVGTSFWFIFLSAVLWSIGLFFFDNSLARSLRIESIVFIDLGIILLFVQAILTTGNNYLNIRKKSKLFLVISLSKLGINIGANLYFIVGLHWGAKGMLYGELLSTGLTGCWVLLYLMRENGLHFRVELVGRMLKFGLPFIPNAFSAALMHRADRFLLPKFTSLSAVGLYGLGYRFPALLNSLILSSFWRIWNTSVMYDVAKQENSQETYAKITTYFATIYVLGQYFLIVMAPTIIKVLAAPEYFPSWKVLQVVGLGFCFYALHNFFVIGAFIKNKTLLLPISHLLSGFINIGLNWYLLPRYGYMAAAWTTVTTYFIFSLLNLVIFQKIYPIPFEFRRLGFLFGCGSVLVLLSNVLYIEHNVLLEFAKELIIAITLPLILLCGPYLERNEKESLGEELLKIHPALSNFYLKIGLKE